MLKGTLYNINKIVEKNNVIEAIVELDVTHNIFKGHFPQQPVLPGVCMMQMVREIFETFFGKKLQLVKADDIRYTAMVDLTKNAHLIFQLQFNRSDEFITTKSKILQTDDVICCRMKATFIISPKV